MVKTIGITPKVYVPAIAQIVVGAVLFFLGNDVEGKTLMLTGLGTFVAGFSVPNSPTVTVSTSDPVDPQDDPAMSVS